MRLSKIAVGVLIVVGAAAAVPAPAQVTSITSGSLTSGLTSLNWPGGIWYYKAVLLDASLTPIGSLVEGTGVSYPLSDLPGNVYPSAVSVTLAAPAPAGQRIRVYRSSGTIVPGDPNQSYADFACPCARGTRGSGSMSNDLFFGPLLDITNGSLANVASWNWPGSGTYYVQAVLLDAGNVAVGSLAPGFSFPGGSIFPSGVSLDLGSAPAGYKIRIYRSLSPIAVGQSGLEYADLACPCNRGSYIGASLPGNPGFLPNGDFTGTGATVAPVELSGFTAD